MPRASRAAATMGDVGEFGFLAGILPHLTGGRGVLVGPGDDCAVIRCGREPFLLTIDALVERVHFQHDWLTPHQVGRKGFLVNASDVAAMGGRPRFCVAALGVPASYPIRDLSALQAGIVEAAGEAGAAVVGGNLTRADQLSVSIAVLAEAPRRLVTRRGARPGDLIYVTGTLGDAALGCRMLQRSSRRRSAIAIRRFREPSPRLRAGRVLVSAGLASAMIDVSDGLLQDLGHLCAASRVGAVIHADDLPLSRAYRAALGDDPTLASSGGEDYELLYTVPKRQVKRLDRVRSTLGCPITMIGEIVTPRRVDLLDANGVAIPVAVGGHDHFRS